MTRLTTFNDLIEDRETVQGSWRLSPNHELSYKARDPDVAVRFKGALVAARPDALVISVTEKQSHGTTTTRLVTLTGAWKANPKNQLTFEVARQGGVYDLLTFRAGWKVNDRHEVVYTYEQADLRTTRRITRELVFRGFWEMSERNRLTYSLGADSRSAFRFRGTFQTDSILAKRGEIRYQVGVEVAGRRTIQTVTLFGTWKISDKFGLAFEVKSAGGRGQTMSFGGQYDFDDSNRIAVHLQSREGTPLGVEVIFTRDFFGKDGQAFVRLRKSIEDSRIEAGVRIRW